tara:strand:- start:434 stop:697 length:264 start_codon:yes stop_codon:yes gene_type:complete
LLEEVPKEGDGLKIQGSAMVALASSKEEVIEKLKADIYAKNEVWDFTKVFLSYYCDRKRDIDSHCRFRFTLSSVLSDIHDLSFKLSL